jgi:signal transduction histidine kinase
MSDPGSHSSELLNVLRQIGPHAHLALIYEGKEEQFAAAIPAIRIGIERREKCVYVADENTSSEVIDALHNEGIDVEAALKSGSLTVATKRDTTLRERPFVPDQLIRFWADAAEAATTAGFSGLRIVAEMTWALHGDPGTERLIEFEAKVNDLVRSHPIVGICQYNRRRFAPEVILNVIRVHSLVYFKGLVCRNFYYVPPEQFLAPHHAQREVEWLLTNLREREQTEQSLRMLSHRLLQAEDEERRRIAKELHDSTAQDLVAVMMNLGLLEEALGGHEKKAGELIADSLAILENSVSDLRTLAYVMHPPQLAETGLAGALTEYAAGFVRRAGIRVQVELPSDLARLPEEIELALFRVVQESLANVLRHAKSDTATIRLTKKEDSMVLEVIDEGCGLPPTMTPESRGALGVGIAGMRERMQHFGGHLELDSGTRGTTVRAVLPLTGKTK